MLVSSTYVPGMPIHHFADLVRFAENPVVLVGSLLMKALVNQTNRILVSDQCPNCRYPKKKEKTLIILYIYI